MQQLHATDEDQKTSVQRLVSQAANSDIDLTVSADWLQLV